MDACDVVVVGGGVTGLGIAHALRASGVRVVLFERDQLGGATSSRSLRIIHGGFRYLPSGDLHRVYSSLRAQAELMRLVPEAIQPLQCIMPLSGVGLEKAPLVWGATKAYDLFRLSARSRLAGAKVFASRRAEAVAPLLKGRARHGALVWSDGLLVDHAGLIDNIRAEYMRNGGAVHERSMVTEIVNEGPWCLVRSSGEETAARVVINAGGGHHAGLTVDGEPCFADVEWVRAFNLVIDRQLATDFAVGLPAPSGRLFFMVPRPVSAGGVATPSTAIGTGYLSLERADASALLSEDDLQPFLEELQVVLGADALSDEDEYKVEWGILPREPGSRVAAPLTKPVLLWKQARYAEVLATKYTTFLPWGRCVAKNVVARMRELK